MNESYFESILAILMKNPLQTKIIVRPPKKCLFQCVCVNTSCPFCNIMTSIRWQIFRTNLSHELQWRTHDNPGVNKKPKKFKTVWHGFQIILKLSGRVNQVRLKLSAGFSNTVCWTSKTCFCVANCLI